jgi:peptidoglycan-N-acetylglucosamine deacetylase
VTAGPAVYLTFDDGPDPESTPRVLAELDGVRATASFFVVGSNVRRWGEVVAAALGAGHGVEVHCMHHRLHSRLGEEAIRADVRDVLAAVADAGARPTRWRPPGGVCGRHTSSIAAEHNLRLCGWSADPFDWDGSTAGVMLDRLGAQVRPGSVVVLHDGLGPGARRRDCTETIRLIRPLASMIRALGCHPRALPQDGEPEPWAPLPDGFHDANELAAS